MSHAMPALVRLYHARLGSVTDADTARLIINCGFGVEIAGPDGKGIRCRFAYVNAPESGTEAGAVAVAYTRQWFAAGDAGAKGVYPYLIASHLIDPYGRPIVTIWNRATGACVNDDLLTSANAVPWPAPKGAMW